MKKNNHFFSCLKSFLLFFKHRFRVSKIVWESESVFSIYITGNDLTDLNIKAGQFMVFRFLSTGLWFRLYPLSISKLPQGGQFRITIKLVGPFTKKISQLSIGTFVLVCGPFGQAKEITLISKKVLLLAGGVAIAPVRPLYEELLRAGKDVALLYASRLKNGFIFKKELDDLALNYSSKIHYVLTGGKSQNKETAHIDLSKIKSLAPDFLERDIYIYGPTTMVESLKSALTRVGLPLEKINFENF